MRNVVSLFFMFFVLVSTSHAQLRNDPFNVLPDSNSSSFRTQSRAFWNYESAKREARHFSPFVYSGGLHGTSTSLTSAVFATEAFVPERVDQIATSIVYTTSTINICWTIISSRNAVIDSWNRVGATAYYFFCQGEGATISIQPALPANSAWLMQVTITNSRIASVTDRRIFGAPEGVMHIRDIRRYGAIPDDGIDDSLAIQSALAARPGTMHSVLHGEVFFPVGDFIVNAAKLSIPSNTTLQGSGRRATFLTTTNISRTIIDTEDAAQGVIIRDMGIRGPGATSTVVGVRYNNSFEGVIQNVTISGFNEGLRLGQGIAAPNSSFSMRIENSFIIGNNTTNIWAERQTGDLELKGTTFGAGSGITPTRGLYFLSSNLSIYGGDCEGVNGPCIDVYNDNTTGTHTGAIIISGVNIENDMSSTDGAIRIRGTDTNNRVIGVNVFGNLFVGGTPASYTPLNLFWADGIVFTGNFVHSSYTNMRPVVNLTTGNVNNFVSFGNRPVDVNPNQIINGKWLLAPYHPGVESAMSNGDTAIPNTGQYRFLTSAGTSTYAGIGGNTSDQVVISASGKDVLYAVPNVALGGGANAVLGPTGGSGPATAAQAYWMRILGSDGIPSWIPVWR